MVLRISEVVDKSVDCLSIVNDYGFNCFNDFCCFDDGFLCFTLFS